MLLVHHPTVSLSLVPWAWGIKGCASVVSAALATLLALYVLVLAAFPQRRIPGKSG